MSLTFGVRPVGTISVLAVATPHLLLSSVAPAAKFRRFQSQKLAEQITTYGAPDLSTIPQHQLGSTSESVKAMLNLVRPIRHAFQEHSTWKIDMHDVDEVFGSKRQPWNRDYPAAQKIFLAPSSFVAKPLVLCQHAYLYGSGLSIKPIQTLRKDLQMVTGCVLDALDFCQLLEYGIRRGKPRMFTYVLMPERLYIAETSAKFFRDIMSKHAMHSSAASEVVYAGELHFRGDLSNATRVELIIDNNSGTYAPSKEDLSKAAQVFRSNFPGLRVRALDFTDPLLEEYRRELLQSGSSPQG